MTSYFVIQLAMANKKSYNVDIKSDKNGGSKR